MMNSFYKDRWILYLDYLRAKLRGEQPQPIDFFHWEHKWVGRNLKIVNDAPKKTLEQMVKILLPDNIADQFSELPELTDSKPIDDMAWDKCKSGYHSAWGSTNVHYTRLNVPEINVMNSRTWKQSAWKGEKINALALLWTTEDCANIQVEVSDLKGRNGAIIPSEAIRTSFLRYVMTDELSKGGKTGCGYRTNHAEFDSLMVADVLDIREICDIKQRST